jgi:hypothetical protein
MNGVTLTHHAYGQLLTESQLAADGNESGGILLGRDLGMGSGFLVCHCGDPGPGAVRQPTHFQRDLAHARMLAERAANSMAQCGSVSGTPISLSCPFRA